MLASMNNGVSMISYRGWAGPSGWYNPSFSTSNLDQVQNNNKIGVMASIVCGTGHYGYSECFGEKWIRMGSSPTSFKGGPAFYGSTNPGTHTKWNNPIMIGYYWGIFEEGIYNFASAAFRGKLHQYNSFPSHNGPGGRIHQYHHTYNTLGEPELEIRTAVPRNMTVTYPSTIPVGTNMMAIHVAGIGGLPLEGAYVNLLKGYGANEEVFVGGRTDGFGDIILDFATTTADTLFVTVTARNYIPHAGYSLVQTQPVAVGVNAIILDDDNSGNSSGNNDGNVNPAETVEFAITLKNFGNSVTATNVQATLTSPSQQVNITVPNQTYGNILPGNTANSGKFAASFADNIPQGEYFILELEITSDQGVWTAAVPVDVKSMYFLHLGSSYPGNPNNRLDPGETSQFVVSLQNTGELAGISLTGDLTTSDPGINIIDGTADFGNIGIGGSGSNSSSPFTVEVDYEIYNGHNVNFDLELTSSNGTVAFRVIPVVIGNVSTFDPVGPDDYGYYMYDNTDAGYDPMPIYSWEEISVSGNRINFSHNTDDDATVVSLPFDFVYYGQSFDYMLVCINGFVAFDTSVYDMDGNRFSNSHNMHIPELGAPRGLIAPYWDDLEYSGGNGVFEYYDDSTHRYIIEWKNCTHARTGAPQTFEMIIYDPDYYPTPTGDSEILFQYQVVNNNDDNSIGEKPGLYCTVGFQNLENNDGLQYTFDNHYHPGAAILQAGRAIKVTTKAGTAPPPEIEYEPSSFFASAGVGQIATDTLHISNVGEGTLVFSLIEVADEPPRPDIYPGIDDAISVAPIGYTHMPNNKEGDREQPIYPPVVADRGGPDAFGYEWIDSDEPGGPAYNWIDISIVGVPIIWPGDADDGIITGLPIGFDFPFYGNS
ncbi:MAG: C25 family cysteine peptidase, partial [candidate division Zixibacteria bacterium]